MAYDIESNQILGPAESIWLEDIARRKAEAALSQGHIALQADAIDAAEAAQAPASPEAQNN